MPSMQRKVQEALYIWGLDTHQEAQRKEDGHAVRLHQLDQLREASLGKD